MRRLWILPVLALMVGCGRDDIQARYRAEKARYWAQREALRFSLQADPQMRRRYYESGLAYLAVAEEAAPGLRQGGLHPKLRGELLELDGWGRLQAGSAFLRAGRFELADTQLTMVQEQGPPGYRREAALLRAEAARARKDWELARQRYHEFQMLLRETKDELQLGEELLVLPLTFVAEVHDNAEESVLREALEDGHAFYAWVRDTWPGDPVARRADFLDHRLDLAAERWEAAREGLARYTAQELGERDQWNARFDLAEILGPGLGRNEEAEAIYRQVGEQAPDPYLQGLAWLRRGELLLAEGRIAEGLEALERVENEYRGDPEVAAAAMMSHAESLQEQGRWSHAQQLYRRIVLRYPDTSPGLLAPLRMIQLQRERGDESAEEGALTAAESQYRRLVAGHSLDGRIGLQARRALIQCLRWGGKPEEAMAELEQLHHILGRGPGGADALLEAAKVANEELGDPGLARRYLEWIVRELPVTPAAAEAREMLQELPGAEPERVED